MAVFTGLDISADHKLSEEGAPKDRAEVPHVHSHDSQHPGTSQWKSKIKVWGRSGARTEDRILR